MREKEHILLETRLTHLHWAEGLILLVAAGSYMAKTSPHGHFMKRLAGFPGP